MKKIFIALTLSTILITSFSKGIFVQAVENKNIQENTYIPNFTEEDRKEQLKISELTQKVNLNNIALEKLKKSTQ